MSANSASDGDDVLRSRGDPTDALRAACQRLVECMRPDGFWEGRLSASALSTATAISALCLADAENDAARIVDGVAWLVQHQNADRGWGDTTDSPSNLATTLLAVAAQQHPEVLHRGTERHVVEINQVERLAWAAKDIGAVAVAMNAQLLDLGEERCNEFHNAVHRGFELAHGSGQPGDKFVPYPTPLSNQGGKFVRSCQKYACGQFLDLNLDRQLHTNRS